MEYNALGQSNCKIFKFSIFLEKNDEIADLNGKGM